MGDIAESTGSLVESRAGWRIFLRGYGLDHHVSVRYVRRWLILQLTPAKAPSTLFSLKVLEA
jgi:hypothetical protein